jgi:hypothetical protein
MAHKTDNNKVTEGVMIETNNKDLISSNPNIIPINPYGNSSINVVPFFAGNSPADIGPLNKSSNTTLIMHGQQSQVRLH